ncbi:MAG: DNA repair protein RecO [Chitinophagales bacterium]
MLEKTEVIVLKATKYGETSLIVKLFSEKFGCIPIILKGIRNGKKNNAGLFQPGYILELNIYYRENKQLFQVKDYAVAYNYQSVAQNIGKQSIVLFIVELLLNVLREHHANKEIFYYIKEFILKLDNEEHRIKAYPLILMYELSQFLGIEPLINQSPTQIYFNLEKGSFDTTFDARLCLDIYHSNLFYHFINSLTTQDQFSISANEQQILLDIWLNYYSIHIPEFRTMQTPKILHDILN